MLISFGTRWLKKATTPLRITRCATTRTACRADTVHIGIPLRDITSGVAVPVGAILARAVAAPARAGHGTAPAPNGPMYLIDNVFNAEELKYTEENI